METTSVELTEQEQLERHRDYAAMGDLDPDSMRRLAADATIRAWTVIRTEPERAWLLLQFAADMLRASMPAKEVA